MWALDMKTAKLQIALETGYDDTGERGFQFSSFEGRAREKLKNLEFGIRG